MTIQEAIKSGKNYKRKGELTWRTQPAYLTPLKDTYHLGSRLLDGNRFTESDILADDWEIQEETIEITKTQLKKAFQFFDSPYTKDLIDPRCVEAFAKALGFKS